ncbi:MAG: hypothetical protein HY300_18330 [Verrucomicrobia bacterium]|nr:hypothetical protein [Verrucomicrobiota bacterium]
MAARRPRSFAVGLKVFSSANAVLCWRCGRKTADVEQVGRNEGRGGNLGVLPQPRAKQAIPRRQINRGVERPQKIEAQLHDLVHEPFAQMKAAVKRMAPGPHAPEREPFDESDFSAQKHDERQRDDRRDAEIPIIVVLVVEDVHHHHAGKNREQHERGEHQHAESLRESEEKTARA